MQSLLCGELVARRRGNDAKSLGNGPIGKTVVLPRLICKAEETKEKEGAEDQRPSAKFKSDGLYRIRPPKEGREGVDSEEIEMSIRPAFPRIDGAGGDVEVEPV